MESMPVLPTLSGDAQETVLLLRQYIPSHLLPYATSGERLQCAIEALSVAIAGLVQYHCGYQFRFRVHNIKQDLEGFVKSPEFEPYARAKLRKFFGAADLKKYDAGQDPEPLDETSNLSHYHIIALYHWYMDRHLSAMKPNVRLIICDTAQFDGALALRQMQIFPEPTTQAESDPKKQAVVIRSVDSSSEAGHWEGFAPLIQGFESDISTTGHPSPITPFMRLTDPRYNNGHIPPKHKCDPNNGSPCSQIGLRQLFEDEGMACMSSSDKTEADKTEADRTKTSASNDGAASMKSTLDLDNLTDEELAKIDPELLVSSQPQTKAESSKAADEEDEVEGYRDAPTHQDMLNDPEFYKEAPLVRLLSRESAPSWVKGVHDAGKSLAYFVEVMQGGQEKILPFRQDPQQNAMVEPFKVKMIGSFSRLDIAPAVHLQIHFVRGKKLAASHSVEQHISFLWPFKPILDWQDSSTTKFLHPMQPGSFKYSVVKAERPYKDEKPYVELEFISNYPVCTNMKMDMIREYTKRHPNEDLTAEERVVLFKLNNMIRNPGTKVKMRFYAFKRDVDFADEKEEPLDLVTAAGKIPPSPDMAGVSIPKAFAMKPFWPYRRLGADNTARIMGIAGQHKLRKNIILTGGPFVMHPVTTRFIDCQHAEIVLSYGMMLEYEEQRVKLTAISKDEHFCGLFQFENFVLMGIRFSQRPRTGLDNDRYSLPANTKLDVALTNVLSESEPVSAAGMTTDMDLNLPGQWNLHVLFTGKEASRIRRLAQKGFVLTNFREYHCRITPEISEVTIKAQLDGVHKAFDPMADNSATQTLMPVLLYSGIDDQLVNPWILLPGDGEKAFEDLVTDTKWEKSQLEAIRGTREMTHGVSLVSGASGSGKTRIQATKALAVVRHGGYVIIASDRNHVVDHVIEVMHAIDPSVKLLRVHARQLGVDDFPNPNRPEQPPPADLSDADLAIFKLLRSAQEGYHAKRYRLSQFSVEQDILERIEQGCDLVDTLPQRDGTAGEEVNYFEYLGQMLSRLWDHKSNLADLCYDQSQKRTLPYRISAASRTAWMPATYDLKPSDTTTHAPHVIETMTPPPRSHEKNCLEYALSRVIELRKTYNLANEPMESTECPQCPQSFKKLRDLVHHMFESHRTDESEIKKGDALFCRCGTCNLSTSMTNTVLDHTLYHKDRKCSVGTNLSYADRERLRNKLVGDYLYRGVTACLTLKEPFLPVNLASIKAEILK